MSTARRRAAFDPTALDDIDELLPPLPAPTRPAPDAAASVDNTRGNAPSATSERGRPTAAATARSQRAASLAAPTRVAPPEVTLAPEVYAALRALTLQERGTNPATARTYGRVALDAIEAHADDLAQHWTGPAGTPAPHVGLFSSSSPISTRRRHSQAPARVPLAGVLRSDVEQLDALVGHWGAGSRSALVEAALRRYLIVEERLQS
jgi:hypothetical protein